MRPIAYNKINQDRLAAIRFVEHCRKITINPAASKKSMFAFFVVSGMLVAFAAAWALV